MVGPKLRPGDDWTAFVYSLKSALKFVPLYIGLQKFLGADRLRYRAIAAAEVKPNERVINSRVRASILSRQIATYTD